ncbi:hypothetical protein Verru16b_02980 [Lacunisphaera limnophila]|uniref:Class I SAM-dependent methyltransferase n=1 Tax=Lacunisphaera limnophila TaxID=1838286 RepID=A0A1D8AYB4_9BACT|nr:class I SAM-dependent methyltransferase [Lacunisphaera limnophila]AOS45889.1 hypothetical protein Verru16b_02980 [Lacunisphaera limnophila]
MRTIKKYCRPLWHILQMLYVAYYARKVRADKFLRFAKPGHYYSPIPSELDVQRAACTRSENADRTFTDLRLPSDSHESLWQELKALTHGSSHGSETAKRFEPNNSFYSGLDAYVCEAIITKLKPRRIIEIGSGYSSALMLDAVAEAGLAVDFTFVDPDPVRLKMLLRESDWKRSRIHTQIVQEVDRSLFEKLEENDILFIDSSHVSKCGSDVNYLLFEILPLVQKGVWIHVHDIPWPFEYSAEWLADGRAWNEAYLVRAFLTNNDSYRIRFMNAWFMQAHPDKIREVGLPSAAQASSLWIQKTGSNG